MKKIIFALAVIVAMASCSDDNDVTPSKKDLQKEQRFDPVPPAETL